MPDSDLMELLGLRNEGPQHGDARHTALGQAQADGGGEAASRVLQAELGGTPTPLLGR